MILLEFVVLLSLQHIYMHESVTCDPVTTRLKSQKSFIVIAHKIARCVKII